MKPYLNKLQIIYILGGVSSLLANLILFIVLFTRNVEITILWGLIIGYFFSFSSIRYDYKVLKVKNKGKYLLFRDISNLDKAFYSLWLTIPSTIIYSWILKNHLSDWKYHSVAMYLVWFLFAIITIWLLKSPWHSAEQETAQNEQGEKTS